MFPLYSLLVILFQHFARSESAAEMTPEKVQGISNFTFKFSNELCKTCNTVSSPLSAEIVLGLLALGTEKKGYQELLQVLGVADDNSIRNTFKSVSKALKSVNGVTLNVVNKVYVQEGSYDLKDELKKDAVDVFNAGLEKLDFKNNVNAANTVNSWVEKETNSRIKDLFEADDFNEDTRVVLVNALYFKGTWKHKFRPELTKERPFKIDAKTEINVPMMYNSKKYKYGVSNALDAQLLIMDYVGEGASMLIVLPRQVEGLAGVMSKLSSGYDLKSEIDKMHETEVDLSLPKFKIETTIDVKALLQKMGVKEIFEGSCLTRMLNSTEPLVVSKAIQKAFIEVNEEGAEAAAATGFNVVNYSGYPEEWNAYFVADHPFFYVILDSDYEIPLFTGMLFGK